MALGSLGSVSYDIIANDMTGAGITSSRAGLLTLGAAFTGIGMTAESVVDGVTATFLEFDTAMTNVKAVALSTGAITEEEFNQMRESAIDMSTQMPITATDFANAMYLMTSVGYDYNEIMAAMPENAKLAVAGQMSMTESTNAMINVFGAYQDTVGSAADVGRVFANAVALGKYEMSDFMTETMKNIGAASQLGITFSELAAYNVAIQNSFTSAEEAGTSLNRMFITMTTTGADTFEELGISLTDTEGHFRKLPDIMRDVKTALEGVSDEQERMNILQDMFGTYGSRSAIALMEQVDTLPSLTEEMATANYGQGQYNVQLDSTANKLQLVNNKMDAAHLAMAEGMIPATELLADLTGDLATVLKDLPEPLQAIAGVGIYAAQGLEYVGEALMGIAALKMLGLGGFLSSISTWLSGLAASASTAATTAGTAIGGSIVAGVGIGIAAGLAGVWVLLKTGIMQGISDVGRSIESSPVGGMIMDALKVLLAPIGSLGAGIIALVQGDFDRIPEVMAEPFNQAGAVIGENIRLIKDGFSGIGGTVAGGVNQLGAAVRSMVQSFSGMGSIAGYAASAFSGIGGAFSGMANQVKGVFSQMFNAILGLINGTRAGFVNAGKNIITSIVNGIVAAGGGIISAIGAVLNKVRDLFPFSPAKEGPLADTPNWGTWMSSGMEKAGPEVSASAAANLAAPAAAGVAGGGGGVGGGAGSGGGGGGDTYHFNVTISGANKATPELANELYMLFSRRMQETRKARGMRSA